MKYMSRENQKLIYWFIDCYAYYLADVEINWVSSKDKPNVSDYFKFLSKEHLKKLYIKASGKNVKGYKPFADLEEKLKGRIEELLDKKYTNKTKANVLVDDLMDFVTEEIQLLFIKLEGVFSLAIKMMKNTEAIAFTNFLFDYFMQNDIPMWAEIHQLYRQQDNRRWVWWMLKSVYVLLQENLMHNWHIFQKALEQWADINMTKVLAILICHCVLNGI